MQCVSPKSTGVDLKGTKLHNSLGNHRALVIEFPALLVYLNASNKSISKFFKSEERAAKTYRTGKLRPMAKSTNSSQEQLKATDSSPSVLPGEPEEEDDTGVYDVPYNDGLWIYVDEREEVNSCRTSFSSPTGMFII